MKIKEIEDNYSIKIEIYVHRAVYKTQYIIKSMFNNSPELIFKKKMKIVDELNESCLYFKNRKREIIKEWSKTDKRFIEVFKELYPKGGHRENAGRPRGQQTKRTERLLYAITKEEKIFLTKQLEKFRAKHNK